MKRFMVLTLALLLTGCMPHYSDGVRVGHVQKLSHKGLVFKSWEGELTLEGISTHGVGDSKDIGNVWDFSVCNDDVLKQVQSAIDSQAKVKIAYDQYFIGPWDISTQYVVKSVEAIK